MSDEDRHDLEAAQEALRIAKQGPPSQLPFRQEMEKSFGRSFHNVEVYVGPSAKMACRQLGAKAFSVGKIVVFAEQNPSRDVVAHELTHVLQQQKNVP